MLNIRIRKADDTKTADAKSENPVRAAVSDNANASPDFETNTDDRTVPESTAVGAPWAPRLRPLIRTTTH